MNSILKYILYIIFFPLSFFLFLIIRIISPIKLIRFGLLNSHRIGHFSLEWEIFWQLNLNENKGLILLSFHKHISNLFLAKMIKRQILIYPTKLIKLLQILNKSFLGNKKHEIDFHYYHYDRLNKLNNFTPSLKFTKKEIIKANDVLKKYSTKKIICFLCRDGKYISQKYKINDYKNIRNTDVDDYVEGFKALENKGYTIFRMGKNVEKKLSYTSDRVIDYANSSMRSDFMDIFLSNKCDFFISNGVGLDGVAIMFNKPILYLNFIPPAAWPVCSEKFLFSFKKFFNLKTKNYLSLSKVFKKNLAYDYLQEKELTQNGFCVKDMTKDEIKDCCLEMENFLKNEKLNTKQKIFKKNFEILTKKYPNKVDNIGNIFPTISINFAERNPFFLN